MWLKVPVYSLPVQSARYAASLITSTKAVKESVSHEKGDGVEVNVECVRKASLIPYQM
jgi:hypothetical protein